MSVQAGRASQTRASTQQRLILRSLARGGTLTIGQLLWVRAAENGAEQLIEQGFDLPAISARADRSGYNSMRRTVDRLVTQGTVVKVRDASGPTRYQLSPPAHTYKTIALASLAEAKLGAEHYGRLIASGASALAVLDAVCGVTGWTLDKGKQVVETVAQVMAEPDLGG